ncbi:GNAT family N-acetyltransferase [Paenibacillus oenotherae]|uniref:GNAT family N-acetyltransferase n=1 Tax=Paenibacillus oenotherae TaxID=1435645 RepID=A0ABS7D6K1_9BACL|nr:GNAT family protein [Paenibacillus oenotherae]MBW7475464.1 GNAT family N-acetyltransferase [Paenibacillus oenotherae]
MLSHVINEDVSLKLLEVRHAEELFRLTDQNREHLREWLPWVDSTMSSTQTEDFIRSSLKAYSDNNGLQLGIVYRGSLAGCIGLHFIDWANRRTSIGYWLAANYQGLGIMTTACKALTDYVFHDLSLNRVEIRAAVRNAKSRAIPERMKFLNEGTVRQAEWLYDHYVDHIIYGMLKEDWA